MNLREAHAADLERLAEIELCGDVCWGTQGLEQAISDENVLLLVAENSEGIIAGFIAALIVADEMQVQNIVVDTRIRRQGTGTALLEKASETAKQSGAVHAYLEVATHNRAAIGLYERFGFKRAGIRRKFYSDGSDALVMQNSL